MVHGLMVLPIIFAALPFRKPSVGPVPEKSPAPLALEDKKPTTRNAAHA